MRVFTGTDIGLMRSENQDKISSGIINEITGFIVLCDGMGGENAGSAASEIAAEAIVERFTKVYRRDLSDDTVRNMMISALNTANSVILDESYSDPEKKGMGTTCVAALERGLKLHVVSVGDSRAYLLNENITQITKDHSIVMQKYEKGEITKEEMRCHPQRNYITKALGIPFNPDPDYFELEINENDIILLCSDGLSTYVEEADILSMSKVYRGDELINMLIKKALDNGGKDNITIGLIYYNMESISL
ncbi:MAG: Stp1/IreP family PP2C-type Ser/Thr phosphatase [Ruminococcus sp.]|nr:Stp1/IreP family PP2C-type Ser/Thr phosphatase [Ruminococcus sp.]